MKKLLLLLIMIVLLVLPSVFGYDSELIVGEKELGFCADNELCLFSSVGYYVGVVDGAYGSGDLPVVVPVVNVSVPELVDDVGIPGGVGLFDLLFFPMICCFVFFLCLLCFLVIRKKEKR